ncbi:MAG: S-layer homology domain-containing protein, partial [Ruminiclostridium sp.]|nr:S-layer homology domain-containing protein [Ruminiclostridium sp.]
EFATMAVRFFSSSYEGEDLFPDIDQHWAKDYINTAAKEGIINGYEDGSFRPDQPITRAEAMTIVNRVLERHPDKDHLLKDMIQWPDNMDTDKWYYADVQEATNSHDYDMKGTEAEPYEVWSKMLPVRDWVAFEKEWSDANSAQGGEVVK